MPQPRKPNGRLVFTPSLPARQYLDQLIARLQSERYLEIRVTLREAFDVLVDLARAGEKFIQAEQQQLLKPPPHA